MTYMQNDNYSNQQQLIELSKKDIKKQQMQSIGLLERGIAEMHGLTNSASLNDLATYRQARLIYNKLTDDGMTRWFGYAERVQPLTDVLNTFQLIANKGFPKAYFPLSTLYTGEQSVESNVDLAALYKELAFEYLYTNRLNEDVEIWCDHGKALLMQEQPDSALAHYWFEKAANRGDVNAMWHLVGLYECDEKWDEALTWQIRAATDGHEKAQQGLIAQHEHGDLYDRIDEGNVIEWYVWSAENGYLFAQLALVSLFSGAIYYGDQKSFENPEKAFYWCKKAAEQGDTNAEQWLGDIYSDGYGVEKSDSDAFYWYEKAALSGDSVAQCILGGMYLNGIGTAKNNEFAIHYYLQSAELGNHHAQAVLGELYELGKGVEEIDFLKAIDWYRKAAAQGHKRAQASLECLEHYIRPNNL